MLRFQLIPHTIICYEFGSTELTLEKGMSHPDERERRPHQVALKKETKTKQKKKLKGKLLTTGAATEISLNASDRAIYQDDTRNDEFLNLKKI